MYGIIGGTGLYAMDGLEVAETREVRTPFGPPSAPIVIGAVGETRVAFLPRHGLHHELLPSEINFRANIWALKSVGVRRVVSVSATGSLVEDIAPGDMAVPSQYFDWTRGRRASSFFGEGLAGHVSTAEPACAALSSQVLGAGRRAEIPLHPGRAYACVEGPRLGTRVESFFLRSAGCHLVGMTNVPEVFLAREAGLCYCTIAIATDYDCWMEDPAQHATVDKVMALYFSNLERVKKLLRTLLSSDAASAPECSCARALDGAILSREERLPADKRELLAFLRSR